MKFRGKFSHRLRTPGLTGKQPVAIEIHHWLHSTDSRLHYDYTAGCTTWITIFRLWWLLSQWRLIHRHHLAVTIYLYVAPSTDRHTSLVRFLATS